MKRKNKSGYISNVLTSDMETWFKNHTSYSFINKDNGTGPKDSEEGTDGNVSSVYTGKTDFQFCLVIRHESR